ncbi:MAG: hypothetical protein ACREJM_03165, partial [Candidatus Saccharimonadales bacterium]
MADGEIIVGDSTVGPSGFETVLLDYGTNGQLDGAFGSNGQVVTPLSSGGELAIATDGSIMAIGDDELLRYSAAGILEGTAVLSSGGSTGSPQTIAIDPSGTVLVAGTYSGGVFAARFNNDLTPDTTFNGTGFVFAASADNTIHGLTFLKLGSGSGLAFLANSFDAFGFVNTPNDLFVYDSSGQADPSVAGNVAASIADLTYIGATSEGRLLVSGTTSAGTGVLGQFTANGTPDTSFGTNGSDMYAAVGRLLVEPGPSTFDAEAGKILVVAGQVWRYTAAGNVDSTV